MNDDELNAKFSARRNELFAPIHQQILMTDDTNDLVLLATNMLTTAIHIYANQYGFADTKTLVDSTLKMYGEINSPR